MPPTKLSFKEQMRDFPVWQIAVISMVRFAEPIAFTSLFPYVYFMVRDFHVVEKENEIAKYVGFLSSSFAFCQFLSSVHWGRFADVVGRKRVLITGLLLTSCALLLFGFSTNFVTALIARSMMGLFNGNVAVIRTVLGEVAVHKRHQAIAFSTLPLLWQIGTIIGPFIGGMLTNVDVSKEYDVRDSFYYRAVQKLIPRNNIVLESLVDRYPYALSNIVVSSGLVICAILCFLFFEETHYEIKYQRDRGVELGDILIKALGFKPPARPWMDDSNKAFPPPDPRVLLGLERKRSAYLRRHSSLGRAPPEFQRGITMARETSPLLQQQRDNNNFAATSLTRGDSYNDNDNDDDELRSIDSSDSERSVHSIGVLSRRQSLALVRTYSKKSNIIEEEALRNNSNGYEWGVLLQSQVFYAIFSNFALSLTNIVVEEFLPVFLATKTERLDNEDPNSPLISKFPFKIVGGLSFDPEEVGNLLSLSGSIGVVLVMFMYPYIDRNYSPVKSFRFFISMTPLVYFSIPFLVFALPPNTPSLSYTKLALYTVAFFKVLGNSICFPQIMLLIHRASPAKNRSFINGTTISVTSFARCIGPFWGYVMSWSDAHELGGVTWWSLSIVAIFSVIPSFLLKDTSEEEEDMTTIIDAEDEEEEA